MRDSASLLSLSQRSKVGNSRMRVCSGAVAVRAVTRCFRSSVTEHLFCVYGSSTNGGIKRSWSPRLKVNSELMSGRAEVQSPQAN